MQAAAAANSNLLKTMRQQSTPPSPHVLGKVGEKHLIRCFQEWYGVKRHWYKKAEGLVDDIPFFFEVLVAETEEKGDLYYGVNFSPTYDDPLSGNPLASPKFDVASFRSFLRAGHALPKFWYEDGAPRTAAVIHLVCPSLGLLDRGKSRLKISNQMTEAISGALWNAVKTLYNEGESHRKNAAKAQRMISNRYKQLHRYSTWTQKDAVFEVLPEAIINATGDGQYPVSARNLYYQVRPLLQDYTDKELDYDYFSQILAGYRKRYGEIIGFYYDPRGILYEPHTGKAVLLGTREVEGYRFPDWLYNKVLYIEKKGLWPILKAAKLAERYDMAVVAGEGYASEAVRALFENASRNQGYQLFVLHDADPHGYNIGRTLREETPRMPGYQVDVIDLGLHLDEALAIGLQTEKFTRTKALPVGIELSELEREHFEGRKVGKKSWICQRVELNAFSAPALVIYIEEKLQAEEAFGKVIPPDDDLVFHAQDIFQDQVNNLVDRHISRLLSLESMKRAVFRSVSPDLSLSKGWVEEAFDEDRSISWEKALQRKCSEIVNEHEAEVADMLQPMLRAHIRRGQNH
jgi:hypothetical protein